MGELGADVWAYSDAQQQYFFKDAGGITRWLPRGTTPTGPPSSYGYGDAPTTVAQDVGSVSRMIFSIPGEIIGATTPLVTEAAKNPLLGPLLARKFGLEQQAQQQAPGAPWSTGKTLAVIGGVGVGAIALGYAFSGSKKKSRR